MHKYPYEVRIGDINYGNHLAHDKLIGLLHDARTRFLEEYELSETSFLDAGLILRNISVRFIQQGFLHDRIDVTVNVLDIKAHKILLGHEAAKAEDGRILALAETELAYFDYDKQQITKLAPELVAKRLGY